MIKQVRRAMLAATAALAIVALTATPAAAYEPVNIVHTEQVVAGPYHLTLGFSTWPLRAMQSLDFTFIPDGGIADKTGTLMLRGPRIPVRAADRPLARHPRKLDVWGLDVTALNNAGTYTFAFHIDGPQGPGEGSTKLEVLDQPGPPLALSWSICALPFAALIAFLIASWRRSHPSHTLLPLTKS